MKDEINIEFIFSLFHLLIEQKDLTYKHFREKYMVYYYYIVTIVLLFFENPGVRFSY